MHTQCPAPSLTLFRNFDHDRSRAWLPEFFLLFILTSPATAQLQNTPSPPPPDPFARLRLDKTMAVVLFILIVVFFIMGFFSVYTRQCAERRMRARFNLAIPVIDDDSDRRCSRGLDPEIIDTFPTFVYSAVKALKIGRVALECAVCLNEFRDDETLRLIPKCSHVFHPDCIDVWLATHPTCPVCRANLVPKPGDMSSVASQIQFPDPGGLGPNRPDPEIDPGEPAVDRNRIDEEDGPVRSRSSRFGIGSLFPRSHSTGQLGENCERFTLRLPEDVRNQLVKSVRTLSRTKSCGLMLQRESSGRRGYRTMRSYLQ